MENFLKSEFWEQQWAAFWSAPPIVGPPILIVGSIVWWFRGATFEREIAGLKEQIGAMEQRLKLNADALAASDRAKDELDKQFQTYKTEVAAKGKNASPAKMDAALVKLAKESALVRAETMEALKDAERALAATKRQ
jgi:hypothetical protein